MQFVLRIEVCPKIMYTVYSQEICFFFCVAGAYVVAMDYLILQLHSQFSFFYF